MPSVTTREYNPTTGALVGNVSSVNFGSVVVGSHSSVRVLDFAFSGITAVSNIKIGVTGCTLDVNESPEDGQDDGSAGNGRLGVMHTDAFDKSLATSMLSRHFAGTNDTGLATNANNVRIGNRTDTVSQFVYLDMEFGGNDVGVASGTYKVFFDFE
jgi:hypothetical protein